MWEQDAHIWHPFSYRTDAPVQRVVRGEGAYLVTESGQRIFDAISSWWVTLHGHAHPQLSAAVARQVHQLEQVIFAGFSHPPAVELVGGLREVLDAHFAHFFFSDNGSTAIEVALKMLLQLHHNRGESRQVFLAFESAYHGDTFGAMSVSSRGVFTRPFDRQLFEVAFLPDPDTTPTGALLEALEAACSRHFVAGLIVEPLILGAGGMKMYAADKLEALVRAAQARGVPVIFDEVFVGFGRTGRLFAHEHIQARPDILCLSKGLTGGYLPMGLTVCTEEIRAAFRGEKVRAFLHGHSFTGSPLACAAAVESLRLLRTPDCQARIAQLCHWQAEGKARMAQLAGVQNVRQTGTVLALTLPATGADATYLSSLGPRIYDYCLAQGVLIRPMGPVVYLVPPYVATRADLELAWQVMEGAIAQALG
ncbi:MAG: adenosylmethionine--8-amino-7-oxononanoate transaminase [Sphingobacteriia bacterium]|jgi:adenosylmethionine-8-amino-7-oxononanoate aminotransferase